MRRKRVIGPIFFVIFGVIASSPQISADPPANSQATTDDGNAACSSCHAEIFNSYSKTPMANASGPATEGVIPGEFNDKISGVHYRVLKENDHVWMNYERESEKFRGQRELLYFLGANRNARDYLFSDQGFVFDAPITWKSRDSRWEMLPSYSEAKQIPLYLPARPDCIGCHASGIRSPIAGTENKFAGSPFQHGGITCERCHGSRRSHGHESSVGLSNRPANSTNTNHDSAIVNPAKLDSSRRDAICMQCHFQGTVAVEQPGKHLYQFQPGERLSEYVHYFLLSGNQPETGQELSQFEALSLSECRRKSGDKMWCGTCHDPHTEISAQQKSGYYRAKCLNCHGEKFAEKHHPEKADCTKCHMPSLPGKDLTHLETTDHRILQYPNARPLPRLQVRGPEGAPLVSFPESDASLATTRDFGLAWASLAQRNIENAAQQAEEYLREALKERPNDPALLTDLAFLELKHGHDKEARELYEQALTFDPLSSDAATDLGILEAKSGNLRRAVDLWNGAFARAPYRSVIGLDLAMTFCAAGQTDAARKYLERVLEFNPDSLKAKQLLAHLDERPVQCTP